jgi:hypothetical protein
VKKLVDTQRLAVDFQTFKKNFIDKPYGFFPVHSRLETKHGEPTNVMLIDMICEWRLVDGKLKFLRVPFSNQEEFDQIVKYLKAAAELLHGAVIENISDLYYPQPTESIR